MNIMEYLYRADSRQKQLELKKVQKADPAYLTIKALKSIDTTSCFGVLHGAIPYLAPNYLVLTTLGPLLAGKYTLGITNIAGYSCITDPGGRPKNIVTTYDHTKEHPNVKHCTVVIAIKLTGKPHGEFGRYITGTLEIDKELATSTVLTLLAYITSVSVGDTAPFDIPQVVVCDPCEFRVTATPAK